MASIVIAITDVYVRRSITLARVTMHPNQLSDSDVAVLLEFFQLYLLIIVILLLLRSPESVIASTMASIVIAITDVYVRRNNRSHQLVCKHTTDGFCYFF